MFAVFGVLLDGRTCPSKSATTCRSNRILRENLRQRIHELVANAEMPVLIIRLRPRHSYCKLPASATSPLGPIGIALVRLFGC